MDDQLQDKYLKRRSRKRSRKRRKGPRRRPEARPPDRPAEPKPPREEEPEPGPREIPTAFPVFLGTDQVTEEHFEEELFTADWQPERGYRRTVDVMTALMRHVFLAEAADCTLYGGEEVVLSTEKGIETARVITPPQWRKVSSGAVKAKILRVVGTSDVRQMSRNRSKELSAFDQCRELIGRLGLEMKLLRAQYLHGGGRVIFYFTAKQRVDFRQLVKELHQALHVRVELKQIGVRDAVKMQGGVGPCGLQVCCNRFLSNFKPVSVRMVKEQNMMMNPQKISGICGRLLCCLEYEHRDYHQHFYNLPSMGQRVRTPEGEGEVVDIKVIEERVKVLDKDGTSKWWEASKLTFKRPAVDKDAVMAEEAVDDEIALD
jgi:cell fate regulator YaaT (PSP1 superfamily)